MNIFIFNINYIIIYYRNYLISIIHYNAVLVSAVIKQKFVSDRFGLKPSVVRTLMETDLQTVRSWVIRTVSGQLTVAIHQPLRQDCHIQVKI